MSSTCSCWRCRLPSSLKYMIRLFIFQENPTTWKSNLNQIDLAQHPANLCKSPINQLKPGLWFTDQPPQKKNIALAVNPMNCAALWQGKWRLVDQESLAHKDKRGTIHTWHSILEFPRLSRIQYNFKRSIICCCVCLPLQISLGTLGYHQSSSTLYMIVYDQLVLPLGLHSHGPWGKCFKLSCHSSWATKKMNVLEFLIGSCIA